MTAAVREQHPWGSTPEVHDQGWENIEPEEVPLRAVGFSQPHLSISGLLEHAAAERPGFTGDPYPHVIVDDERPWVVDGHHRAILAILRGAETIRARVRRWPW